MIEIVLEIFQNKIVVCIVRPKKGNIITSALIDIKFIISAILSFLNREIVEVDF